MKRLKLKPAEGKVIRDPRTFEQLPPEGAKIEINAYWLRRLKAGEVLIVPEAPVDEPKKENRFKRKADL